MSKKGFIKVFEILLPNRPFHSMEQRALKNVNNCLNTKNYSYLETSGGESYILYLNVVHFSQHKW